jgi:hypothetical protein
MRRGCFRVRSLWTDVLGAIPAEERVTRCVSIADASLSLSLSLAEIF